MTSEGAVHVCYRSLEKSLHCERNQKFLTSSQLVFNLTPTKEAGFSFYEVLSLVIFMFEEES